MMHGYKKYHDGVEYVCEVGNLYGHPMVGKNCVQDPGRVAAGVRLRPVRVGPGATSSSSATASAPAHR
eukprot:1551363-Prymnesium_polylepis.1